MSNVINNAISLFMLCIFAIATIFSLKLGDIFFNSVSDAVSASFDNVFISIVKENWLAIRYYIQTGADFILIVSVAMIFWSSFVSRYDFGSYIVGFFGSVITSGIVYYVSAIVLPALILGLQIELTDIANYFISNLGPLLLLNFLGFTASWIFSSTARKPESIG